MEAVTPAAGLVQPDVGDAHEDARGSPPAWRLLAVLCTLLGFGSISTDVYLPARPTMGLALHAGAGPMEWTVSSYLAGFSIGQLFWGPIGDRFGRKRPIAVGIALFVAGSAGCALSSSVGQIIASRVLQALGACAGVVLGRAIVRDLYAGDRAAQMLSTLMTVMGIAPLLGPIVGGQVLALAGWRAIFWLLVGVGVVIMAALVSIPETLPRERRSMVPPGRAIAQYFALLRDRRIVVPALAGGAFFAGSFAYVAGTPLAFITYHHVPPRYFGLLFGSGVAGIIGSNMINARLVARLGGRHMLRLGGVLAAAAGVVSAIVAMTDFGGLAGLAIALMAYLCASGLIMANSIAGAMTDFPDRAGAVSAIVGAIHYGSGMAGSAAVGLLADGTPRPLGLVIAAAGIACLASVACLRPGAVARRI